MRKIAGRDWRYYVGLSGLMFVILVILWLTGNLREATQIALSP